jgi:hypothetical protein
MVLVSSCESRPTSPLCGGVCGGNGPVTLQVVNPTSTFKVHYGWRWSGQNILVDSIGPLDSACVHFTAQVWGAVSGGYGPQTTGATGGSYLSQAFDPLQLPHWRLLAQPAPRPASGNYGFVVTNPASGC